MQYSSQPGKFPLAFAGMGNKRTVPENSLIGTNQGYASLADGFPPLCATPLVAGGIPPDILDMNGILNQTTAVSRWSNAGGGYTYDSTFANDTNVNGYPIGSQLLRADGQGYWLNTVDNNTSNPDSGGAGWVPGVAYGQLSIALTSGSTTTLTSPQAGYKTLIFTGTLDIVLLLVFVPAVAITFFALPLIEERAIAFIAGTVPLRQNARRLAYVLVIPFSAALAFLGIYLTGVMQDGLGKPRTTSWLAYAIVLAFGFLASGVRRYLQAKHFDMNRLWKME